MTHSVTLAPVWAQGPVWAEEAPIGLGPPVWVPFVLGDFRVWAGGLPSGLKVFRFGLRVSHLGCLPSGIEPSVWAGVFLSVLGPPNWARSSYTLSFVFLKLWLSLSYYRSDQFGYRVIVIEVGAKLSRAHHCKLHISKLCRQALLFYGNAKRSIRFCSTALVTKTRLVYESMQDCLH